MMSDRSVSRTVRMHWATLDNVSQAWTVPFKPDLFHRIESSCRVMRPAQLHPASLHAYMPAPGNLSSEPFLFIP